MEQIQKLAVRSKLAFENGKDKLDERGATGVEYGMLVALIAAVIVLTVQALGVKVGAAFTKINNALP